MDGQMDRIRDEMARSADNAIVKVIGEHLTAYLQARPQTKLRDGATIKGAVGRMSSEARKTAKGNMGALDFLTGMRIVYEEFGLPWDKKTCMQVQMAMYDDMYAAAPVQIEMQAPETQTLADEFSLDAFLGG